MSTNMTGFGEFSLHACALGEGSLSIGRVKHEISVRECWHAVSGH